MKSFSLVNSKFYLCYPQNWTKCELCFGMRLFPVCLNSARTMYFPCRTSRKSTPIIWIFFFETTFSIGPGIRGIQRLKTSTYTDLHGETTHKFLTRIGESVKKLELGMETSLGFYFRLSLYLLFFCVKINISIHCDRRKLLKGMLLFFVDN